MSEAIALENYLHTQALMLWAEDLFEFAYLHKGAELIDALRTISQDITPVPDRFIYEALDTLTGCNLTESQLRRILITLGLIAGEEI